MPKLSKRRSQSRTLLYRRLTIENTKNQNTDEHCTSEEEKNTIIDYEEEFQPLDFLDESMVDNIADFFELCRSSCNLKYLSVLLYMTMRHFEVTWCDCDDFLKKIGALKSETAYKWTRSFVLGNFDQFCSEHRGGKHNSKLYDYFYELEVQGKIFALQQCLKKPANFTAKHLANVIDSKFYEITDAIKNDNDPLIRSLASCRLDLRKWGARFEQNSQRPCFEDHDRSDVIEDREKFIQYFLDHKDHYYTVSEDDNPLWVVPSKSPPRILL